MKCSFCGGRSRKVFTAKGYDVLDCADCAHRFAGVEPTAGHAEVHYSDEYFNGGGAGYSDYAAEAELLTKRGAMYADLIAPYCMPGEMLDVGAAAGYLLKGFSQKGWKGVGIDPNGSMVSLAKHKLGLDLEQGTLETYVTDKKFDLVSMIQVAAHFFDPELSVQKARDLLKPSGHLLIETWDRGSLSARILGKHWHEYSPPTVLHWYSKAWLKFYLESNGFERVAGGRPSKKITGGHIRSLLKYRLGDISLLNLVPERIELPYPAEDLFWALYRKR